MTMMNPELLPNSANLFLGQYFYSRRVQDRQIDNKEIRITKKIIFPIIKSKSKEGIIQESDITTFMSSCQVISHILHNKYGFKKTVQNDLEVYQMCLLKIDQSGLSNENKDMMHYLLDSLKDYTLNIIQISERKKELKNIPDQIDYVDFLKSLYGSTLAFICVMIGLLGSPSIKIRTNVLTLLINEGFRFATNLDSYTDTLDILTNPDELELLEKAESNIK